MLELGCSQCFVRLSHRQTAIGSGQVGTDAIVTGFVVLALQFAASLVALHGDRSSGIDSVTNGHNIFTVISSAHESDP